MPTAAYASVNTAENPSRFVQAVSGNMFHSTIFQSPMHHDWKGFVEAIQQDLEPPACGEWGCLTMEILLAAEEPLITGREVMLASGPGGFNKTSGTPVTIKHSWF